MSAIDEKKAATPTVEPGTEAKAEERPGAEAKPAAEASLAAPAAAEEAVPHSGSASEGAKMVLTVTLFTLVSAGLLGFVYRQTKPRIEESRRNEKVQAFNAILPEFDNKPLDERECLDPPGADEKSCLRTMYRATRGGVPVGYAVETFTTDGFGPRIDLLVGCSPDLAVTGVYILAHQETPGLGAKATEGQTEWRSLDGPRPQPFLLQFFGRKPGEFDFRVRKDGGEVDSITASTITSRAVANVVAESLAMAGRAIGAAVPEGGAP
jgi:electron transport complex protein RnfG